MTNDSERYPCELVTHRHTGSQIWWLTDPPPYPFCTATVYLWRNYGALVHLRLIICKTFKTCPVSEFALKARVRISARRYVKSLGVCTWEWRTAGCTCTKQVTKRPQALTLVARYLYCCPQMLSSWTHPIKALNTSTHAARFLLYHSNRRTIDDREISSSARLTFHTA
jgi:hypothetical protein